MVRGRSADQGFGGWKTVIPEKKNQRTLVFDISNIDIVKILIVDAKYTHTQTYFFEFMLRFPDAKYGTKICVFISSSLYTRGPISNLVKINEEIAGSTYRKRTNMFIYSQIRTSIN